MNSYKKEVSELFSLTQEQMEANNAVNADMDLLIEKNSQLDKDIANLALELQTACNEKAALQESLDANEQALAKIEESNVAAIENQARKSIYVEKVESDKVSGGCILRVDVCISLYVSLTIRFSC